jgi:hypothetical protein
MKWFSICSRRTFDLKPAQIRARAAYASTKGSPTRYTGVISPFGGKGASVKLVALRAYYLDPA